MANFLQNLAHAAQQKIGQVYHAVVNDVSNIGAAPHPVQTMSPQAQQSIQNARYGVLANNPQAQQRFIQSAQNVQRQAAPSMVHGLNNLGNAFNNATYTVGMKGIVQPFVTQPIGDIASTIAQHPVTPWAPGGASGRQALYGQQTFKPVLGGGQSGLYDSTRNHFQQSHNPVVRVLAKPIAAADVAMHVANDVPAIGAGAKAIEKGAMKVAPEATKVVQGAAKEALPAINKAVRTAQQKATTNTAIDAGINDITKQQKALQTKINNAPLSATRGTESLQQHINILEGQKAQLNANRPTMSRTERVLAMRPGGSMRPVRPAVATDPLAALKQEALKYKSADEFVNSHSPVYHGTNADLTDISQLQSGRQRGEYSSGTRSIFASENPNLAAAYGKNVLEGRNTGKVLDTTKLGDPHDPNNMVVPKEFSDYKTNPILDGTDRRVLENSYFKGGTPSNIIIDHKPNIQEYFKSKGYSAIQIPRGSDVAGPATEMSIIDHGKIKSRQQLTDLYNQAHADKAMGDLNSMLKGESTPKVTRQKVVRTQTADGNIKVGDVLQHTGANGMGGKVVKIYADGRFDMAVNDPKHGRYLVTTDPKRLQAHGNDVNTLYKKVDTTQTPPLQQNGWHGQAHAEATDPLAQLKQEALKYKSADEFVKAQQSGVRNDLKVGDSRLAHVDGRQRQIEITSVGPKNIKYKFDVPDNSWRTNPDGTRTMIEGTKSLEGQMPKSTPMSIRTNEIASNKVNLPDLYNQAHAEAGAATPSSDFAKGEKVGFAGILSPSGEARTGTFVRQVDRHLAEVNYGDHTELNHVNNLYKLDQAHAEANRFKLPGGVDDTPELAIVKQRLSDLNSKAIAAHDAGNKVLAKQLTEQYNALVPESQRLLKEAKQVQDNKPTAPKATPAPVQPKPSAKRQLPASRGTGGGSLPKNNTKAPVRNADAERQALETLQKGGTNDQAVYSYMKATGSDLQNATKDVARVAQEAGLTVNGKKNPLLGSVKVPKVQEGDFAQANHNAKFVQAHEQRVGKQATDSFNKLSTNDKVLLKEIEAKPVEEVAKSAENPAAFTKAAKDIRTYYDTRHAYDNYLGMDVGYRANYLRHIFDKAEETNPESQVKIKNGNKNVGYTKARTKDSIASDVGATLERDIKGSSFNHAKLTYEKGLNEAFPGKIANGQAVATPADGQYDQIQHPFGKALFAPKEVAHEINTRTWAPADSKALETYDKINHGLKYAKLSGGFFHAFTEAGNFVGQQLASGKLVTDPADTGKLFKVFMNPKAMEAETARLEANGTMDNARLAGLTTSPKEVLGDVSVNLRAKAVDKVTKYTGLQAMHDATFQREIPYAKLKIFEQKTQGLDAHNPADLAKMRQIARETNQIFGGIDRMTSGIKPGTFRWLQRGLLATDFTEGKLHTLSDALTSKGPAGNLARQTVAGKAVLFAVLATAGAATSGDYKGKNPGQIAKDAAGKLLSPSFTAGGYTASLPKTHISEAVDALKPYNQAKGAPYNLSGVQHYLTSRLAAAPSEAAQLISNKDYYGQPIYGKNTKKNGGGPISPAKTALNVVNTVAPIPFGQGVNTAQGKQNLGAAVGNVAGLNVRPTPQPKMPSSGSYKAQAKTAPQPTKGIYTVKGKDGSTKYATLQGSNLRSYTSLNDAKTAQAKNMFKYSKQTVTTINGQMYHKTTSGTVVKGAPPAPNTSSTITTYDPKTNTWTRTSKTTGRVVKIDAKGKQTVVRAGTSSRSSKGTLGLGAKGGFKAYKSNLGAAIKAAKATSTGSDKYAVAKVHLSSKMRPNTISGYKQPKLTLRKRA